MIIEKNVSRIANSALDSGGVYCAYLRKSRDDIELERSGDYDVLKRHRETLLELSHRYGVVISKFYEEVVSGDSIDSRPEMLSLIRDVDAGMWNGVFVMEVERLARGDTIDQGRVSRSFQYSDTLIITPLKIYDPSDEYDQEYFEFGLFMSRREYKTIKRRLNRGRLRSVQEGKYVGNVPPFGYERVRLEGDTGFTLKPVPEEAAIVKLAFDLYVNGDGETSIRYGMQRIADYLNSRGMFARSCNKWTTSTLRGILSNPVYCGYVRWNRRKQVKKIVDGKIVTSRPINNDYDVCKGLHEPIISVDLYNRAEQLRRENPCIPVGTQHSQKNPLSGLVFCSHCGSPMQRKPYYQAGKKAAFICPTHGCPTISDYLDKVENEVLHSLEELCNGYKYVLPSEQINNNALESKLTLIKSKQKEVDDITSRREKLFDFLERGVYTESVFAERMVKLENDMKEATASLNTVKVDYEVLAKKIKEREEFVPKCETLLSNYNLLSPIEKNTFLKELIDKIVYTKNVKNKRGNVDEVLFTLDVYPKINPL